MGLQLFDLLVARSGINFNQYMAPEMIRCAYYEFLRVATTSEEIIMIHDLLLECGETVEEIKQFMSSRN
jgi:hypothetical protein